MLDVIFIDKYTQNIIFRLKHELNFYVIQINAVFALNEISSSAIKRNSVDAITQCFILGFI